MPRVLFLHLAQDQSLHLDPLHPGPGRDAGRHLALLDRQGQDPPLYGLLDLCELHRSAGDRTCQDQPRRPLRQGLLYRLRRDDWYRRRHQYRQGRDRLHSDRLRPRRYRSQRSAGPAPCRRRHDHRRRHQPRPQGMGRKVRYDPLRQSEGSRRGYRSLSGQHDQASWRPDRRC
ncbi:hypothetical protein D3C71_1422520 [compost metagenome]